MSSAEAIGEIVGFGIVLPAKCEIRAIYAHPNVGRRGVGTALLRRLELMAIERGLSRLDVNASVNAEGFYHKNGYSFIEHAFYPLAPGVQMACIKMYKSVIERTEPKGG